MYGGPEPYIYGVYTVFLAGRSPNIRCIYRVLANPMNLSTTRDATIMQLNQDCGFKP